MRFGLGKFAAAQMPQTQRIVATRIERIAPQRFAPVNVGRTRGVTILFQMQAGDEKLVGAGDVFRRGRLGGGRRDFAFHARLRADTKSVRVRPIVSDANQQIRFGNAFRQLDCFKQRARRRKVALETREFVSLCAMIVTTARG